MLLNLSDTFAKCCRTHVTNHGGRAGALEHRYQVGCAVAVGRDLDEALEICLLSESVAQVFFYSSLLGKAHSLHRDVVDAEVAIFRMQQKGIR